MVRRYLHTEDSVGEEVDYVLQRREYPIQRKKPRLEGGAPARISLNSKYSVLRETSKLNYNFSYFLISIK